MICKNNIDRETELTVGKEYHVFEKINDILVKVKNNNNEIEIYCLSRFS